MSRLFQSGKGIFFLLLFIGFVEYYSFAAVKSAMRGGAPLARGIVYGIYFTFVVLLYVILINFRRWGLESKDWTGTKYVLVFVVGFFLLKIIAATFMFIGDIYRLLRYAISASSAAGNPEITASSIPRSQFLGMAAIAIGATLMGTMLWGIRNRYRYQVKKVKVKLANLPPEFEGFTIVQISDIHAGSFDDSEAVKHGVDMVLEQNADVIFFTGDLVNNIAPEILPYKEIFSQLKAPHGVYSILGNHDYGDYSEWDTPEAKAQNLVDLRQHQADMGWKLLDNEHVFLVKDGAKIALIGVQNWGNRIGFPKYGDMVKATAGLAEANVPVKILLSHDPSHWDGQVSVDYKDIDLTLSGHTHGMQFGVRLAWMQWSPVQYVYKHWMGMYREGQQRLYVNPGYGFIGYKGRVGILPEITVLELVRA